MTFYIVVDFSVSPKTLSIPFLVSASLCDSVIDKQLYRNYPITVSQKIILVDLVEIDMIDFDIILAWISYISIIPQSNIEIDSLILFS